MLHDFQSHKNWHQPEECLLGYEAETQRNPYRNTVVRKTLGNHVESAIQGDTEQSKGAELRVHSREHDTTRFGY